jgi:hypothetical protein
MSRCQGRLVTHVLFIRPSVVSDSWVNTDLWSTASTIPGVKILIDREGVEASHFGAFTSGQVALYDQKGCLVYSGGITGARGHRGDNPGEQAVIAAVNQGARSLRQSSVYGCPLAGPDTRNPKERGGRPCRAI